MQNLAEIMDIILGILSWIWKIIVGILIGGIGLHMYNKRNIQKQSGNNSIAQQAPDCHEPQQAGRDNINYKGCNFNYPNSEQLSTSSMNEALSKPPMRDPCEYDLEHEERFILRETKAMFIKHGIHYMHNLDLDFASALEYIRGKSYHAAASLYRRMFDSIVGILNCENKPILSTKLNRELDKLNSYGLTMDRNDNDEIKKAFDTINLLLCYIFAYGEDDGSN